MPNSDLQIKIENVRVKAGVDKEKLEWVLYLKFRVSQVSSLSDSQAWVLIRHLERLAR